MKQTIESIPYVLLIIWLIFSIIYLIKAKRNPKDINPHIFESIPQVFPTIGILGTFLGIAYGLFYFDVKDMDNSIPELLNGLKTAFIASIFGIIGLLIFSKWAAFVQHANERSNVSSSDELTALNTIIEYTKQSLEDNDKNFKIITNSVVGESDESLITQFVKMRNQLTDQTAALEKIQYALGGDKETSLLTQIQKLRAEQGEYAKQTSQNTSKIVETMNSNNTIISQKFEEFTKLLTENNTKALVEAMEKVIVDFNSQMNELIQRLVKENFEELNTSVKNLNDWQKENKTQIATLIDQFNQTTENLESSSQSIMEISNNTKELTDNNSILKRLIQELREVMIEDKKFAEITSKLQTATNSIESSSTNLSDYIIKEKGFKESINMLLDKLKEIEQIKDLNGKFWKDVEFQMKEGVNIISTSNEKLAKDVERLDGVFRNRLNDSFIALDKVLQSMVLDYQKKTGEVIKALRN